VSAIKLIYLITLKHTQYPSLSPLSKNRKTPENSINTTFSGVNTSIFLSADRRSPHVFSLETEIQYLKYNHLINSPHFLQSNCQLARFKVILLIHHFDFSFLDKFLQ